MYEIKKILNTIIQGNALNELKKFPSESIDCVITSPPYWALRDYGLEPVIWDGDKDCRHEWKTEVTKQDNLRFRGHNSIVGNCKNPNIYSNNKVKSDFCSKCFAWCGSLGLEPTFDDQIIEIEIMELRNDLTEEELKEIKKYFSLDK